MSRGFAGVRLGTPAARRLCLWCMHACLVKGGGLETGEGLYALPLQCSMGRAKEATMTVGVIRLTKPKFGFSERGKPRTTFTTKSKVSSSSYLVT